ncbi:MAG: DUF1549 domain-containing protein [Gemmataceae bacterium]
MPRLTFALSGFLGLLLWANTSCTQAQSTPNSSELSSRLGEQQNTTPTFLNDVIPILTRVGCNQGACHGKNSGQNGFRLSLRGYAPELDHQYLTREFLSRRVNKSFPEKSLLLLKPLGQVPHEGGTLLSEESRAYKVLLEWIKAGSPGPLPNTPKIQELTVSPNQQTTKAGEQIQLQVKAKYNNQWRDVTWLTKFASNDSSVATVDELGKVKVVRPGETAVRAHFQGRVAVAIVTAPHPTSLRSELYTTHNNFIDDHIFAKLAALQIEPSKLCSDEYFIRRVHLDMIGTLPTSQEVRAFLNDQRKDKRTRLVNGLFERPEFVDFWTLQLGDLLQNRKESDHDVRGAKDVRSFHQWLRTQVAKNRPWNELAREVLTVKGTTKDHPAVGYYIVTVGEHRNAHESDVVSAVAQTFLGTRIGCAKCHNHPLEKHTQDDYYRFAGFFSRIKFKRQRSDKGPTELMVSAWNERDNKRPIGVVQPRTRMFLAARPLDRSSMDLKPGDDPRIALAKWITSPKNEYFAGAMVNRLWAHFFKVGLVEPIDDLRASNPPSNPMLWDSLVKEFVARKYDIRHMIRLIVNSRAYQLDSQTTENNKRDQRFYSHYYARRMTAEVLLDALSSVTGVPEQFPGYPRGMRAIQIPDPTARTYASTVFGKSERITACACERNNEITLPQVLFLRGSDPFNEKLRSNAGRLAKWLKAKNSDKELIDELYLTSVARLPVERERSLIMRLRAKAENRDEFMRDLFWAVLNSHEFVFNH